MGSEMCIRDSRARVPSRGVLARRTPRVRDDSQRCGRSHAPVRGAERAYHMFPAYKRSCGTLLALQRERPGRSAREERVQWRLAPRLLRGQPALGSPLAARALRVQPLKQLLTLSALLLLGARAAQDKRRLRLEPLVRARGRGERRVARRPAEQRNLRGEGARPPAWR